MYPVCQLYGELARTFWFVCRHSKELKRPALKQFCKGDSHDGFWVMGPLHFDPETGLPSTLVKDSRTCSYNGRYRHTWELEGKAVNPKCTIC